MTRLAGTLVLPEGLAPGEVSFDARIADVALRGEPVAPGPVRPRGTAPKPGDGSEAGRIAEELGRLAGAGLGPPYVLPGFVDVHVHGGGGGDAMDGSDGVRTMAEFHVRHGTTTIFPTTMTNPFERVLDALRGIAAVVREGVAEDGPVRADIPGAHLEGPFLSPERLGAQPPFAVAPTPERMDAVLATGAVRLVTLAPEVDGALAAAERFAREGIRVSAGHTRATYEIVVDLIERVSRAGGEVAFTHLYNAMGGVESRVPGVVGAALAYPEAWTELILDLHHIHPGSALAAWRAKGERMILITDAIRAAGMPEGETELGGQAVRVSGGAARLVSNGTLAGSVLTLDAALRNAISIGVPLVRASRALSGAPAAYLGLEDRGRLAAGTRSDLVVLDGDLKVTDVFVAGRRVAG